MTPQPQPADTHIYTHRLPHTHVHTERQGLTHRHIHTHTYTHRETYTDKQTSTHTHKGAGTILKNTLYLSQSFARNLAQHPKSLGQPSFVCKTCHRGSKLHTEVTALLGSEWGLFLSGGHHGVRRLLRQMWHRANYYFPNPDLRQLGLI